MDKALEKIVYDPISDRQLESLRHTMSDWPGSMCGPAYAVPRLVARVDQGEERIRELEKKLAKYERNPLEETA